MKTKSIKTVAAGILSVMILAVTSCEKNSANTGDEYLASFLSISADGISSVLQGNMLQALTITTSPSPDEIIILTALREEEKLARDVYSTFSQRWGHMVFNRISLAESSHLNAANSILVYYGAPDTLITETGVFKDPELQNLYNDLVSKGTTSIEEAFKSGALIEEMDIKALQEAITKVSNENIKMVLENLYRGSRNHLRAFNRQLKVREISYIPEYISMEQFNEIVNSPVEAGNRYRMNPNRPCINGK